LSHYQDVSEGAERRPDREEAAQDHDPIRAHGEELMFDKARDHREISGWMSDENLIWPSVDSHRAIARRRRDLYDAMRGLESAVARPSGLADWRIDIESALSYLLSALEDHADETEAEGGLFTQIQEHAPHLAAATTSLSQEHDDLLMACRDVLSLAADLSDTSLRRRVNRLLVRLAIHRQTGAELLYDTYNVDIAPGD
jgi:hypothetical protein